jgi:hypothetical protein
MNGVQNLPLNTVDRALAFAGEVSQELKREHRAWRMYHVFSSLAQDPFEALLAFLIWKARGESYRRFSRARCA